MVDKIELDKQGMKAINSDTRLEILKVLNKKDYTMSDIAEKLNLKKPTIKDHLEILETADLIEKEDTDRKWKYYKITPKGKAIVEQKEVKVTFLFILNIVALIGTAIFGTIRHYAKKAATTMTFGARNIAYDAAEPLMQEALEDGAAIMADEAGGAMLNEIATDTVAAKAAPLMAEALPEITTTTTTYLPKDMLITIIIFVLLTFTAGLLLGFILKKPKYYEIR